MDGLQTSAYLVVVPSAACWSFANTEVNGFVLGCSGFVV